MGEGLREIPQQLAGVDVDLLGDHDLFGREQLAKVVTGIRVGDSERSGHLCLSSFCRIQGVLSRQCSRADQSGTRVQKLEGPS